jgi:hypothetical protein
MAGQHGTLLTGMNGMLGQMRMHGGLTTMMQDPADAERGGDARSTRRARTSKQMATAFNAMAKNMTSAMKGLPHGAR